MPNKHEKQYFIGDNKLILPHQPYHDDFLQTITSIFISARWFGVAGASRFSWKVWGLLLLILLCLVELAAIWKVIKALAGWAVDTSGSRSVTARLAGAVFYSSSILSLIFCWRLSSSWANLSAHWINVERMLFSSVPSDVTLKRRLILMTTFMTVCCAVEHGMSMVSAVGFDCPASLIVKHYILYSHGFILMKSDYTPWIVPPILIASNIATILWTFQDLIIILISMGLTSRYDRLNKYVAKVCAVEKKEIECGEEKREVLSVYKWRRIREAYVKQAFLVRKVDDTIGSIIFLSSSTNFYFICLQLFMGITQGMSGSTLKGLYYLMSLAWICVRVICVVLAASDVNASSTKALQYLYTCHARCFNVEVERLQNQLAEDNVTLSGMGFFTLNRTILLQMASAIITYEMVLIQFDDKST